jgi:hypothetical protein
MCPRWSEASGLRLTQAAGCLHGQRVALDAKTWAVEQCCTARDCRNLNPSGRKARPCPRSGTDLGRIRATCVRGPAPAPVGPRCDGYCRRPETRCGHHCRHLPSSDYPAPLVRGIARFQFHRPRSDPPRLRGSPNGEPTQGRGSSPCEICACRGRVWVATGSGRGVDDRSGPASLRRRGPRLRKS